MPTILLVEDEAALLILADSILQEAGYTTVTAANVTQAFALLAAEDKAIDLVFTDISLGEAVQGGLEVAHKAVHINPETRVLYTTGQAVTDGMRELFVEGSELLPKPYTEPQLKNAVASLLG
jgi:CheY-like chemotaxis protein